uniref:Uncharacterized protein n=1 Tax=Arundo donax TaxID=35708 RepID=A0A0A9H3X2_ARUDO
MGAVLCPRKCKVYSIFKIQLSDAYN